MAWLYKRGKRWWIAWRASGKLFRKTLGRASKAEAEQELARLELLLGQSARARLDDAILESLVRRPAASPPLKPAVAEYLSHIAQSVGKASLQTQSLALARLLEHVNANDTRPTLRDISTATVMEFLDEQRKRLSAGTANNHRSAMHSFFDEQIRRGRLSANPVDAIKRFKSKPDDDGERRAFTISEIRQAYAHAPDPFWKYMILGACTTGLRLGDLATLEWVEIDWERNMIHRRMRKTRNMVHLPIAADFRNVLLKRWHEGIVGPVWPEQADRYEKRNASPFSKEFRSILVDAGLAEPFVRGGGKGRNARRPVSELTFHSLRHSFVTLLQMGGASAAVSKCLAGHGSDAIHALYSDLPEAVLADAVSKLPSI